MRITKRLKVGSLITCKGDKDLKSSLKELGDRGYGAVACGRYRITITSIPEEEKDGENKTDEL